MEKMSIWRYANSYSKVVPEQYRLENSAGNTALQSLSDGDRELFLKREDLNPTGSHKDRSLCFQLSAHISDGVDHFAISSSGNSVISAVSLVKDRPDITLDIFLPTKLSDAKKTRLEAVAAVSLDTDREIFQHNNLIFHFSTKPLSDSIKASRTSGAKLIRGSQDPYAVEGFKSLGYEILEQRPEVTDIFIPVSSGTTLVGVAKALTELGTSVRVHACQTEAVNLIAREFDKDFTPADDSIADSIVDKIGHRRAEVINAVRSSRGGGWVIADSEIGKAQDFLSSNGIHCSADGALALASYKKAEKNGWEMTVPVCIISGTE